MGWSLRVRLRRFDLVNLVFLKLDLAFSRKTVIPVVMVSALRGAFDLWLSRLDLWRLSQWLLGTWSQSLLRLTWLALL
jgi:hypothetical protein